MHQPGHRGDVDQLAAALRGDAGERQVAAGSDGSTLFSAARGNPLAVSYPSDGSVLIISPSSIVKGTKHPNAARLYMEFLYSIEASEINVKHFGMPLRPEVAGGPGTQPLSKIKVIRPTVEEVERISGWRDGLALVAGIALRPCSGALFVLVVNGIGIGTVFGHLQQIGYGDPLWRFVCGHAPFELTAIVLAGGAGLRLGLSLVAPGRHRRIDALAIAGAKGARLCLGVAFMLLVAAFIEAFWSSTQSIPAAVKYSVSGVLWTLVAVWLGLGGRGVADED